MAPLTVKMFQSGVIPAPIEEVWPKVRNSFGSAYAEWHPLVRTCQPLNGEPLDRVGAIRQAICEDDSEWHETLLALDDTNYIVKYDLLKHPLPTTNYVGTMQLFKITDTNETFMHWSSEGQVASKEDGDMLVPLVEEQVFAAGIKGLQELFSKKA